MEGLPADVLRLIFTADPLRTTSDLLPLRLVCTRWRRLVSTLPVRLEITNRNMGALGHLVDQFPALYCLSFGDRRYRRVPTPMVEFGPLLRATCLTELELSFKALKRIGSVVFRSLTQLRRIKSLRSSPSSPLFDLASPLTSLESISLDTYLPPIRSLRQFPRLTHLELRGEICYSPLEWTEQISTLTNLVSLSLPNHMRLSGSMFKDMPLRSLDLRNARNCPVTSLQFLSPRLHELRFLVSSWDRVTALSIGPLISHLTKLRVLHMRGMTELRDLRVGPSRVYPQQIPALDRLPFLRTFGSDSLGQFSSLGPNFPPLRRLILSGAQPERDQKVTLLTTLTELRFAPSVPSMAIERLVVSLVVLTGLVNLHLKGKNYSPYLTSLQGLTQLQKLYVRRSHITGGAVVALSALTRLTHLTLLSFKLEKVAPAAFLLELAELKTLRYFGIGHRNAVAGKSFQLKDCRVQLIYK